jgi:SAM-dependent methyltransferase
MSIGVLAVRRVGAELLDNPAAPAETVKLTLRNIARSNRWFGGAWALRHGLSRVLANAPRGVGVTLLDLGTGSGDLADAAIAWGARRGLEIRPVGLELNAVAARLAHSRGISMVVGCAGTPPIADKSVDVVSLCLVAHHFEPESVVQLIRVCDRLARVGVVICDLRRAALAAVAFRIGARLLDFDPVTVADGLTSIRRGYTQAELAGLLARGGVGPARVVERPGWRLVATWRTATA